MVGTGTQRFGFAMVAMLLVAGTAAAQSSRLDQNLMIEVRNGRVERVAALLHAASSEERTNEQRDVLTRILRDAGAGD